MRSASPERLSMKASAIQLLEVARADRELGGGAAQIVRVAERAGVEHAYPVGLAKRWVKRRAMVGGLVGMGVL